MPCARCAICEKKSPVTLHIFPKDAEMLALWKQICKYDDRDDVSRLRICTNHFLPEDYFEPNAKRIGGRLKLRPDAVPSVRVPNRLKRCEDMVVASDKPVAYVKAKNVQSMVAIIPVVTETPAARQSPDTTRSVAERLSSPTIHTMGGTTSMPNELIPIKIESTDSTPVVDVYDDALPSATKKRRFYSPRYVGEITCADVATPRKAIRALALARDDIKKKAQTIRRLQAKVRRLRTKVLSLEELVKHPKRGT